MEDDELWDVYDRDRKLTGRLHRRGDPLAEGELHLAVHVWLRDSRGLFLLTRRWPQKPYAGYWETTGGAAVAGEDSLQTALREVREETGIVLEPERGRLLRTFRREHLFLDVWLFRQDTPLADVVLQEGETCEARYTNLAAIRALDRAGRLVPYSYLPDFLSEMANKPAT